MGTIVRSLGRFATRARFEDLDEDALAAAKVHVLDAIGCAIGALGAGPVEAIREHTLELGGAPRSTLIGGGRRGPRRTAPDRAALYNGALVRYLDFNDSYLARDETCHPSDNLAPVLAAAEFAGASGRDLLVALAVAYEVQCRLSAAAPVRARGFDHTTQGAYAVAAGVSRALGLDAERAANAVAIAGTWLASLRVSRTGSLSNWKGLAYPATAFGATEAALLAARGVTGPPEVFEGNKGFMDTIAGQFEVDWSDRRLEAIGACALKRYNAEVHSQSAIEATLALRAAHRLSGAEVERVELETFDVAFNIIGGGEEGDKKRVATKEQADHSLPYLLAVALLDGDVTPAQYAPERIGAPDVQELLARVEVREDPELSRRFPQSEPCRVRIHLRDGRTLEREQPDYLGYPSRPMGWGDVRGKFERLATGIAGPRRVERIAETVERLEEASAADLAAVLALDADERGE